MTIPPKPVQMPVPTILLAAHVVVAAETPPLRRIGKRAPSHTDLGLRASLPSQAKRMACKLWRNVYKS